MDLRFTPEEDAFRKEVRAYLDELLHGEFAVIRGRGGPGDEHAFFDERLAWERRLGADGWTCVGWPARFGGRGLPLNQQVIYFEEYARAGGPGRLGHIGEGLIGPTLIHFGSPDQQERFLPAIRLGQELWCQGYSEPDAGSDLANVATRAVLATNSEGRDEWVIDGQKVWTSLAHWSDWCFVLARTDRDAPKHKGISFLLIRMDAPGIEIRPIVQLTGTSEFNEVFFAGARTPADLVVGDVNGGWKVAMGLLSFERGASTLGQQFGFERELREITEVAQANGRAHDPAFRQRLASAWSRLEIMRWNSQRMLTHADEPQLSGASYIAKLYWARFHRDLGELFLDARGSDGLVGGDWAGSTDDGGYELSAAQRLFLYTRADTIYGGSDQIQRNIIGERALGLPPEPRPGNASHPEVGDRTVPVPPYVEGHRLLEGRTVVVTAAAGTGIGSAVARRCVEEGATVVISDAHERRLAEAAESLSQLAGRPVLGVPCNVTVQADIDRLFADAIEELGHIDVVVNNAGLGGTADVVDMTDEQWNLVLDVTLTGTFRATRAALGHMLARRSGVIVNNASVLGWRAQAGQAHYAAAKAGVMALTRCTAIEAASSGVRVNAVAPSLAMHPFLAKVTSDDLLDELTTREAFGRAAEPWEIANVIVFLASDYSSYLTGEVVSVSSQHA